MKSSKKFRISTKFDQPSVYHNRRYYKLWSAKIVQSGKSKSIELKIVHSETGKWKETNEIMANLELYQELVNYAKSKGMTAIDLTKQLN